MIKSVESRMISDFPIPFYLSGGMDTTSIVSIASKVLDKKVIVFLLWIKIPDIMKEKILI